MTKDKKEEQKKEDENNKDPIEEPTPEEILEDLSSKEDEINQLKEDLQKQKEKTEEYLSYSQRLQADFDNFKKINEKQNKEIIKYANENLISNILDSYEDLGRALNNSKTFEELKEGIELINNKLKDTLNKEGLEEIPAKGEKFDPFKHEALMVENNEEIDNGYIIEELMKGYTFKDKVIKYSKVKVCKK